MTGRTSGLEKYTGEEISVYGTKDQSTAPTPSFDVISFKGFFRAPAPKLSSSFSSLANWSAQTNQEFGIKFALPRFSTSTAVSGSDVQPNFAAGDGTVTLGDLDIPAGIYPDTNFGGGTFAIFVNPRITNRESCEQFGTSDPRYFSSRTLGGIRYAELTDGEGSMGTFYSDYYFHTFQNDLCYELAFQFIASNTGSQDLGCRVPVVGEKGEVNVIEALASRVSFFRPTTKVAAAANQNPDPNVTSFTASSETADDATNRGVIRFSWSTHDTDYVRLSYRCSVAELGVVILEEGGSGNCDNGRDPALHNTERFNRSPNSSTNVIFGNHRDDDPITIVVTITPFSHGKPNSQSTKSLTVMVDPANPFPKGVHPELRNMTILYPASADGTSRYQQGAPLKIEWTDSLSSDQCANLYLVQDNGSGEEIFRLQIVHQCLAPARSGSYTWTIPAKYSGSGFRIYAVTPGGTSSALGAPFSIFRSEAGTP